MLIMPKISSDPLARSFLKSKPPDPSPLAKDGAKKGTYQSPLKLKLLAPLVKPLLESTLQKPSQHLLPRPRPQPLRLSRH